MSPVCANMIAVASGKGGVGKTWMSITLAQALARLGQRVLLFDGDLGLANVDVQLGLQAKQDLSGVLAGRYALNDAIIRHDEGGFDVIAGRSGSGGLANIPAARLAKLLAELNDEARKYDSVVLDLGAGIERTVRQLAAQAGCCLIVTSDEPTALTDAYAFMKLSYMHKPDSDLRVVVNMASSRIEGERTYTTLRKACENFLKVSPQLAGIVGRDDKVKNAIRHQSPILTRYPTSLAAEDVTKLARNLMESHRFPMAT